MKSMNFDLLNYVVIDTKFSCFFFGRWTCKEEDTDQVALAQIKVVCTGDAILMQSLASNCKSAERIRLDEYRIKEREWRDMKFTF